MCKPHPQCGLGCGLQLCTRGTQSFVSRRTPSDWHPLLFPLIPPACSGVWVDFLFFSCALPHPQVATQDGLSFAAETTETLLAPNHEVPSAHARCPARSPGALLLPRPKPFSDDGGRETEAWEWPAVPFRLCFIPSAFLKCKFES